MLKDLQSNFLEALLDPHKKFTGTGRFHVYQNAYRARLMDSIEEDFPETLALLKSTQDIHAELKKFVEKNPSKYWTLSEYSKDFPKYLNEQSFSTLVVDLAKLELAETLTTLLGEKIQTSMLDQEKPMGILFTGTLSLLTNFSQAHLLRGDSHPSPTTGLVHLAVYSSTQSPVVTELSESEYLFILRSQSGSSIDEAIVGLDDLVPELTERIQEWTGKRLIVGLVNRDP